MKGIALYPPILGSKTGVYRGVHVFFFIFDPKMNCLRIPTLYVLSKIPFVLWIMEL